MVVITVAAVVAAVSSAAVVLAVDAVSVALLALEPPVSSMAGTATAAVTRHARMRPNRTMHRISPAGLAAGAGGGGGGTCVGTATLSAAHTTTTSQLEYTAN